MNIKYEIAPLSVNTAWKGRRFKSDEYEAYELELLYKLPKRPKVKGWIDINFKFYVKNYGGRDVDNLIKPLLDICVKMNYIEDDRKVVRVSAEKVRCAKNQEEGFEIEIKPSLIPAEAKKT